MTNDTQAPERLWANVTTWGEGKPLCGEWNYRDVGSAEDTEYIRADLAAAQLSEMTRRRDEWRRKAEGYDELAAAVRAGIEEAGDRNLSRVFLRGALVDSERRLRDLEDRVAAQTAAPADASAALDALIAERVREARENALQEAVNHIRQYGTTIVDDWARNVLRLAADNLEVDALASDGGRND